VMRRREGWKKKRKGKERKGILGLCVNAKGEGKEKRKDGKGEEREGEWGQLFYYGWFEEDDVRYLLLTNSAVIPNNVGLYFHLNA
jgi:hypothetical protein